MSRVRNKKRWPKVVLFIVLGLFIGVGVYGYTIYHNLQKTAQSVHDPLDRKSEIERSSEVDVKKKEPFSVLMLGVDERPDDQGRSDTMIVLSVNPNKQSVDMLSIPRDTRVEIAGKGGEDKINHAYAFGGVEMAMNTVEKFLDIPIDYYVKINMDGFKDIVNAVGGVTVNNDLDFTVGKHQFPKGEINLNGNEALSYVRMRYDDHRGDFGRQKRQRQVIQGVIRRGANISALWKYDDLLDAVVTNVKTNLTFDKMKHIQKHYSAARQKINQHELNGSGTKIDGTYYYIVPEEERAKVQNQLQAHLELK